MYNEDTKMLKGGKCEMIKITKNKKLTIFTIIIGILICGFLLFWCGNLSSTQGNFICQETQLGINLLLEICILWFMGFIIYKVSEHEKLIQECQKQNEKIEKLVENNNELLEYIIDKNEIDFTNLQNFNQNNRELLLRMYYNRGSDIND